MARGKYLSLEEARKQKDGLKQFAKEHSSKGDKRQFDEMFNAMATGEPIITQRFECDGKPFLDAIEELDRLFVDGQLSREVIRGLVELFKEANSALSITGRHSRGSAAEGTVVTRLVFEPSNRLHDLLLAARAGKSESRVSGKDH